MADNYRPSSDDAFLRNYQPSDLRIASEFLTSWLPFLSKDLCHCCKEALSVSVRSLDPELESKHELSALERSEISTNAIIIPTPRATIRDDMEPEIIPEPSTSRSANTSGATDRSHRMLWADMAQEDEAEEEEVEEEENQEPAKKNLEDGNFNEETPLKTIQKPQLSRDVREHIRFTKVKRKKDFVCLERIDGKLVNILDGLELHEGVFSVVEQKRIVNYVYKLQEMGQNGEFYERTFSAPVKWMKGKGRVTIQFGCCYNYAVDREGNPPGILQNEVADPLPDLFKVMIRRLVRWHVLPPTSVPDSCIVNIYEQGDCIPPHIDNHDFVRPFCTVSFLSECNILFSSNLKTVSAGEFSGSLAIPLPVGSVLVLNGNGADVAKHCVPSVPTKRISITFRKMDPYKWPIDFILEPDLQGIQPLSYGEEEQKAKPKHNSLSDSKARPLEQAMKRADSPRVSSLSDPVYSRRRWASSHKRKPMF